MIMLRPIYFSIPMLLLFLPFVHGQDCESILRFAFSKEREVVLYNLSPDFDSVVWELGDGQVHSQREGGVVVAYDSFPRQVCLTVYTASGCVDESCVELYPGSPQDICQTGDCIWPGDANGDGKANHFDLLPIGMGYGTDGKPRTHFPIPEQPTAWMPNFSLDWQADINGINFKHLDANGDGYIAEDDVPAIRQNYKPDLEYQSQQYEEGPIVYLEFLDSLVTVDPEDPEPIELGIRVGIGSEGSPATDIQGVAFSLDYPGLIVEQGSVSLDYDSASFFGSPSEVLTFYQDLLPVNLSRVDVAAIRKGPLPISGFGDLFKGSFIVIADIAVGKGETVIPFEINLGKVMLIDGKGRTLPVRLESQAASVGLQIGTVTSARNQLPPNASLSLFPNPAGQQAQLQWTGLQPQQVEVFDAFGRRVFRSRPTGNNLSWRTDQWASGIYTVRIRTSEGIFARRLTVR